MSKFQNLRSILNPNKLTFFTIDVFCRLDVRLVFVLNPQWIHQMIKTSSSIFIVLSVIIILIFIYFLSLFFSNPQNTYYKVLIANAATSALRLHQRLPRVSFTKEFLRQLLLEDSCHYLLFSLIYLYVSPALLIILPVTLFALLHVASYSLTLLDVSLIF